MTEKKKKEKDHSGELYRVADLVVTPVSRTEAFLYSHNAQAAVMLPSHLAFLLPSCVSFRTLKEHTRSIARKLDMSAESLSEVLDQFSLLADRGFFVRRKKVVKGLGHDPAGLYPGIGTHAVVTRSRPEALHRCLESHMSQSRQKGERRRFLVLDDSEGQALDGDRSTVEKLAKEWDQEAVFVGREEKLRFVELLAEAVGKKGIPRETVEFALLNPTACDRSVGANRNSLMLACTGELALSFDDDTVGRISIKMEPEQGLSVTGALDPTEFFFYSDGKEAIKAHSPAPADLAGLHQALLGRTPGDCLDALDLTADLLDMDRASPGQISRLLSGQGRVVATVSGFVGDSGMGSPVYFLSLSGESRARLAGSYSRHCTTRGVLRASRRHTISDSGYLMSHVVGLDCRAGLPPFFPVQRNADGIFGVTLRVCRDDHFIGHLPHAVEHDPVEARSFTREELMNARSLLRTADVVLICVRSFAALPKTGSWEERIRRLGRHLQELGELSEASFDELIRFHRYQTLASYITHLSSLLEINSSKPGQWADDVEEVMENIGESLEKRIQTAPVDLAGRLGEDEAKRLMRRLVLEYGRLVSAWPDLLQAAIDLRQEGRGLLPPMESRQAR